MLPTRVCHIWNELYTFEISFDFFLSQIGKINMGVYGSVRLLQLTLMFKHLPFTNKTVLYLQGNTSLMARVLS